MRLVVKRSKFKTYEERYTVELMKKDIQWNIQWIEVDFSINKCLSGNSSQKYYGILGIFHLVTLLALTGKQRVFQPGSVCS